MACIESSYPKTGKFTPLTHFVEHVTVAMATATSSAMAASSSCSFSRIASETLKGLVSLSANLVYLSDHEIGSTIPSGVAMMKIMMMVLIKCSDLEKKKEKNKKLKVKVKFDRSFLFW